MTLAEIEQELFTTNPDYLADLGGVGLGKLAPFMESAVLAMQKRDWVSVGHRGQSVACLRGASTTNIDNGSSNYKIAPSIGTPAARALQSIGLAKSSNRPVLCLMGNAALGDGQLFEALKSGCSSKYTCHLCRLRTRHQQDAHCPKYSCNH